MYQFLSQVDYGPSNLPPTEYDATLLALEDNDAVIKVLIKTRAPTMRHIARTHTEFI